MGKIKLNLVSGAIVEKPLVCAFKANNMEYVVLDNEMNGSMGLPIILVCKYINNRLIKIEDQNEWQIVKEYLKNIIAGSGVELVKIPNELPADDIYYTQLTLPVPSFDALKGAYKIEDTNTVASTNVNASPMSAVGPMPEVNPAPETPSVNAAVNEPVSPVVEPAPSVEPPKVEQPVIEPEIKPVVEPTIPTPEPEKVVEPAPTIEPVKPVEPTPAVEPVAPVQNVEVAPAPQVSEVTPTTASTEPAIDLSASIPTFNEGTQNEVATPNADMFKEQKEAFMQACENMFDALVQKFERELEKNK